MKILPFVTLLFLSITSFSQPGKKPASQKTPSQADINKMMEDAMKDLTPEQKKMMQDMMNSKMQVPSNNNGRLVPEKQTVLLSKIPKLSSETEYNAFITKLKLQALAKIKAETVSAVNELVEKYKSNKTGLNNIPLTLFMQGQTEASIYAAIICAQLNSKIQISQNNLAFILHQTGYPHFALPLLEYCLQKYPDAVMYNNAGQCYFTLGDTTKAYKYFGASIRLNDNMAEAHCGTALILIDQKKETEATVHIQKAFKDGYSSLLEDAVTNHNIKLQTDKMIKPVDDYFKPGDYALIPPIHSREDLVNKYQKIELLQSTLSKWQQQSEASAGSFKTGDQSWETKKVKGIFTRPYGRKAWFMMHLLSRELYQFTKDCMVNLLQISNKVSKEYNKMEQGIEESYKTGSFNSDYDECKMKEGYLNAYLSATFVTSKTAGEMIHKKLLTIINQQLYWQGFILDSAEFKHQYFTLGTSVLSNQISFSSLQKLYPLPINIATACNEVLMHPPNPDDIEGANKKCSYSIKIPAVIGSFKITCDGWEIEGGEGIVVNLIVKNNPEHDFTIAFGPGVEEHIGPVSSGMKAQFYISCNDGGPTDMGFRGEIKSELNLIAKQYEGGYAGQIGISGIKVEKMDGSGNDPKAIFKYDPKK